MTTAREMDSQFEWAAHEPEARKEGVDARVIDVIKQRMPTAGLEESDATVIELGRQIFRDHKVTPETFAKAKALFGPNKLVELVMLSPGGFFRDLTAPHIRVDCRLVFLLPAAGAAALGSFVNFSAQAANSATTPASRPQPYVLRVLSS